VPSRRGRPPDKERGRPLRKGGLQVTDALNAVDASTIADQGGAVVDLTAERRRLLVRALGLEPTVPVPCQGICRCYGAVLGGWPA
jgi:uncharacterized metal-binding protein YceD (DUF177 family)